MNQTNKLYLNQTEMIMVLRAGAGAAVHICVPGEYVSAPLGSGRPSIHMVYIDVTD